MILQYLIKDKTFKPTVVTAKDRYNKYKPIFKCMLDVQNIHATDKHAFIINCLAQCKKTHGNVRY